MLIATFSGGQGGGAAQTEGGVEGQEEDYSFSQRRRAARRPKGVGTNVVSIYGDEASQMRHPVRERRWKRWKDYFHHHLHTFVSISRVIGLVSLPSHSRRRYHVTEPPIVSAVPERGSGVINRVGRLGGGGQDFIYTSSSLLAHLRFSSAPPLLGGPNAPPKCSVWLRRRQKKLFYANSLSDISLFTDASCSDSILFPWRTHFQRALN